MWANVYTFTASNALFIVDYYLSHKETCSFDRTGRADSLGRAEWRPVTLCLHNKCFFTFFDFFSVFNYVPPSIIGSIIYHIGVYVNSYCVSTLKQILYNMIKRSIAFF